MKFVARVLRIPRHLIIIYAHQRSGSRAHMCVHRRPVGICIIHRFGTRAGERKREEEEEDDNGGTWKESSFIARLSGDPREARAAVFAQLSGFGGGGGGGTREIGYEFDGMYSDEGVFFVARVIREMRFWWVDWHVTYSVNNDDDNGVVIEGAEVLAVSLNRIQNVDFLWNYL